MNSTYIIEAILIRKNVEWRDYTFFLKHNLKSMLMVKFIVFVRF